MDNFIDYRQILKLELENRIQKNKFYSLRAYARDINIGVAQLSQVLRGNQGLSTQKATVIAQNLNFTKSELDFFCALVEAYDSRSRGTRKIALIKLREFDVTALTGLLDQVRKSFL